MQDVDLDERRRCRYQAESFPSGGIIVFDVLKGIQSLELKKGSSYCNHDLCLSNYPSRLHPNKKFKMIRSLLLLLLLLLFGPRWCNVPLMYQKVVL